LLQADGLRRLVKRFQVLAPCERRIVAGLENVMKVIVKFIEGGRKAPQGRLQADGLEALIFVLKVLYNLKGQTIGKIWAVFAGWAREIDRFDWQGLSYSMGHSTHALMLTLIF
jgi:hypothetical protein